MAPAALPDEFAAPLGALRRQRPDLRLEVRWHSSVTSTMDVAAEAVSEGAAQGVVILADEQTSGRGRRGNTWASPPGAGVYFSLVCRPVVAASLPRLTLAAGVGVREGIQFATGLAADLKWPNDLVVGGRKVAGILAEGWAVGSPHQAVVVGVGINIRPAAYPSEVAARATSLEGELGRPCDRGEVLSHVLAALMDGASRLDRDPGDILQAWRAASPSAAGTRVEWATTGGIRHGVTTGIDETGALLVRTRSGIERVIAGDVRWPSFEYRARIPHTE